MTCKVNNSDDSLPFKVYDSSHQEVTSEETSKYSQAVQIELPSTWVPKSSFITSSYWSTVLSPVFGVQWAATLIIRINEYKHNNMKNNRWNKIHGWHIKKDYQFKEHPVGNAMPASRPFSDINLRTVFSKVSHKSVINIPGFKIDLMYFRTYLSVIKANS